MKKIRVLIADDSLIYRSQIKQALSHALNIDVVAAVTNGRYALEVLKYGKIDLLILDL